MEDLTTEKAQAVPLTGFGLWVTTDDQAGLIITSVEVGSMANYARQQTPPRSTNDLI